LAYGSLIKNAEKNGVSQDYINKINGKETTSNARIRSAFILQLSKMVANGQMKFFQEDMREIIYEANQKINPQSIQLANVRNSLTYAGVLSNNDERIIEIDPKFGLINEPFIKAINRYNFLIGTKEGQDELRSVFALPFNHRQGFNIRHEYVQKTLKHEFAKPVKPKEI
jgi:hypothetical protein